MYSQSGIVTFHLHGKIIQPSFCQTMYKIILYFVFQQPGKFVRPAVRYF